MNKPAFRLIALLTLSISPSTVLKADYQAPYYYSTNGSTVAITGYDGPGGEVIIPDSLYVSALTNTLPVTSIGNYAFYYRTSLARVTIGSNVTSIGSYAFCACFGLTNVVIGNNVTGIGNVAFSECFGLTNLVIGNSVTNIGEAAFLDCRMSRVTIPKGATWIGTNAFGECTSLIGVYFQGNAPSSNDWVFNCDNNLTVYYLPGTKGWTSRFGGMPTELWNPQPQADASFGVQNKQFGFNITGNSNLEIVVEACTNFGNGDWAPLQTVNLTNGSFYFCDPQWTNYPGRFYRIRSP